MLDGMTGETEAGLIERTAGIVASPTFSVIVYSLIMTSAVSRD